MSHFHQVNMVKITAHDSSHTCAYTHVQLESSSLRMTTNASTFTVISTLTEILNLSTSVLNNSTYFHQIPFPIFSNKSPFPT